VLNKLLDSTREGATKQLSAEERQSRLDLIGSIVAGITAAVDPSAVATVLAGANIEAENNYLSETQKAQRNEEIRGCLSPLCVITAEVKWAAIDAGQDASFYTGVVAGVPAGMYDLARGLVQIAASPLETYAALKSLFESGDVLEKVPAAIKQSYIERITRMEEEYQRAGASGSFNSGVEGGKLLFDVAGLVTVATGVAKSGAILTEKVAAQVAKNAARAGGITQGANDASNIANLAKLRGQLIGQEIAGGHAFKKHVVQQAEYKDLGITTRDQFAEHIESSVNNPTSFRELSGARRILG